MPITCVPKSYIYACDIPHCSATHTQENANGHYTESTPEGWSTLTWYYPNVKHNVIRLSGLLCPAHSTKFSDLWDKVSSS